MADAAQIVQGWKQTVEAAYQQVPGATVPSAFGKVDPGDPELQRQADDARKSRNADDYVQSTGQLPPEEEIPQLFGGWGRNRRR